MTKRRILGVTLALVLGFAAPVLAQNTASSSSKSSGTVYNKSGPINMQGGSYVAPKNQQSSKGTTQPYVQKEGKRQATQTTKQQTMTDAEKKRRTAQAAAEYNRTLASNRARAQKNLKTIPSPFPSWFGKGWGSEEQDEAYGKKKKKKKAS